MFFVVVQNPLLYGAYSIQLEGSDADARKLFSRVALRQLLATILADTVEIIPLVVQRVYECCQISFPLFLVSSSFVL